MTHTADPTSDLVTLDDVEVLDSDVSRGLVALACESATGELVCTCEAGVVRTYVQRGRMAWASDGQHRRAFTGHLKKHAGLETAAVEAVVEECRSSGRPIGETLVARGLASEEQVRAALRHQIGLALHVGQCRRNGRVLFTPRAYAEYDERFTFTASEVVEEEQDVARACYAAIAGGARCACED